METELGRTVISALSALSGMVIACRSRSESNKVLAEQEVGTVNASEHRPVAMACRYSPHLTETSSIKSSRKRRPSVEAGEALAVIVPELLHEILEHVDSETTKLQESIADTSRSKARRQRDLDMRRLKFASSENNQKAQ